MKYTILLLIIIPYSWIAHSQVKELKITILSTMLADTMGKGEWGFSALVEADGKKILFDAGTDSNMVKSNAKLWNIDLSDVSMLVLSHSHDDHTGGWHVLKNSFAKTNPDAYSTTYVGDGFFAERFSADHRFLYSMKNDSLRYIREGGRFIICKTFTKVLPGIYLTGAVPRKYEEKNYPRGLQVHNTDGFTEDIIKEDMSLVVSTTKGLVLLSGCGHAGIINTVACIQQHLKGDLYAAIGGFHLLEAKEGQLNRTSSFLKKAGMKYFIGAHCTGIDAVYQLRKLCGLERASCVVGSVGSCFDLSKGIIPGWLAH